MAWRAGSGPRAVVCAPQDYTKTELHSECLTLVGRLQQYSTKTILKLLQSCALSTLLYGSLSLKVTSLPVFDTKSLQRFLGIFLLSFITNEDLFIWCKQEEMETITKERDGGGLDALRKEGSNNTPHPHCSSSACSFAVIVVLCGFF